MSRSYKKFPGYTDYSRGYTKWSKRQASKKVRRILDVPSGKGYRKIYNPYDIRDWKSIYYRESDFTHYSYWLGRMVEMTQTEIYRAKMK